jgi:hypothetical protein
MQMIRTIFFVATAYIAYRTATHVVAEHAKPLALLPAPSARGVGTKGFPRDLLIVGPELCVDGLSDVA